MNDPQTHGVTHIRSVGDGAPLHQLRAKSRNQKYPVLSANVG